MKTRFVFIFFFLFALLNSQLVGSPFSKMEHNQRLDSGTFLSKLDVEQTEILSKNLLPFKIFTSIPYINELLAEEEVEEKKKINKKSSYSVIQQINKNSQSLLKFIFSPLTFDSHIVSREPFYKRYHRWKIHLF